MRASLTAMVVGLLLVLESSGAARSGAGQLTLEQQVGQLIVLSFPGTVPPRFVRDALRGQRVAGVVLFGGNIASRTQLRTLTGALRREGGRVLVAVDQEGGRVRRVPWAPPVAWQAEQLAEGTVGSQALAGAHALRELGITVTFAPVADVPSIRNAAIAQRAFSSDPTEVGKAVRAAVRGWRSGGVAPTVKHFPGLGGARSNTDHAHVTIRRSRAALEAVDLPPFAAVVSAGVPLVMVGHARYPALDRSRIASQSEPIIAGVLRDQLGFRGVVITDSMEAQASLATGAITTVCERAIRAGADLVLLTGKGSYPPVYDHLLAVARRSPSFRARVRRSAARVLALKARYG